MPLTPEDVQNKRFTTVRFKEGYDEEEVDAFLDEVEAELRRLLAEKESGPAPAPAPAAAAEEEPNEAALRTLLLAQRTADDAIAQAKAEADQIVAQAKVRASTIESEARAQHASAVAELERERGGLAAQIEELRAFEQEYRARLKAYLEGQLRDLEFRGLAVPSGPPSVAGVTAAGSPPVPMPAPTAGPSVPVPVPVPMPEPPAADNDPHDPRSAEGEGSAEDGAGAEPPAATTSPFTPAPPPLVEDVDAGSDAPNGPPREPATDEESDNTH
jgi:DivIVA domain-containing protein